MSVRFNSASDLCGRAANLPAALSSTICGWTAFRAAGAGTRRPLFIYGSAGSAQEQLLQIYTDNTFYITGPGGTQSFSAPPPTDGTWFFWYLRCGAAGAGNLQGGWRAQGSPTWTTAAAAGGAFTPAFLHLAGGYYAFNTDADFAYFKAFDSALSDVELNAQYLSSGPVKAARFQLDLVNAATAAVDSSGNGYDFTISDLTDGTNNPTFPGGVTRAPARMGGNLSGGFRG